MRVDQMDVARLQRLLHSRAIRHAVVGSPPSPRRWTRLLEQPVAHEDAKVRNPARRSSPSELINDPGARKLTAVRLDVGRDSYGCVQHRQPFRMLTRKPS